MSTIVGDFKNALNLHGLGAIIEMAHKEQTPFDACSFLN